MGLVQATSGAGKGRLSEYEGALADDFSLNRGPYDDPLFENPLIEFSNIEMPGTAVSQPSASPPLQKKQGGKIDGILEQRENSQKKKKKIFFK